MWIVEGYTIAVYGSRGGVEGCRGPVEGYIGAVYCKGQQRSSRGGAEGYSRSYRALDGCRSSSLVEGFRGAVSSALEGSRGVTYM